MNLIRREDPDSIGTPVYGQKRTDAYGCEYVYAKARQAVVLNTAYLLLHDENGVEAATIPSDAATHKQVIVADKAAATGAGVWCAVYGPHDLLIPGDAKNDVGDAVKIHTDGVVTVTDAAQDDAIIAEFATQIEAHGTGTSVTSKVFLFGDYITFT